MRDCNIRFSACRSGRRKPILQGRSAPGRDELRVGLPVVPVHALAARPAAGRAGAAGLVACRLGSPGRSCTRRGSSRRSLGTRCACCWFFDRRMARADAQVSGGQQDERGCLAEVVRERVVMRLVVRFCVTRMIAPEPVHGDRAGGGVRGLLGEVWQACLRGGCRPAGDHRGRAGAVEGLQECRCHRQAAGCLWERRPRVS
jgi:hypothetical protein